MVGKENFSILIVDDDPTVVRVLSSILSEFTPLRFATSGYGALKLARQATPDLVLLDVEMPGLGGFEVCRQFKTDKTLAAVPIIFVTGHESAELQTAGLKLGAADFITKPPHAALVVARVRALLGTKRLSDTLRNAMTMDFMTGTSNRVHFDKAFQQEWLRARRSAAPLCLILLEIDDFAALEAECGDEAVENALRAVAEVLRTAVHRPADLLARYAAGTFAALLPETDFTGASAVARSVEQEVGRSELSIARSSGHLRLSICTGIACSTGLHDASPTNAAPKEALSAAAARALAAARTARSTL
jgi:diguanylate cyclase (GGDEF)-like protein